MGWYYTINGISVSLYEFITLYKELENGDYLFDKENNVFYWIPKNRWTFYNFYNETLSIDINENIRLLLEKKTNTDNNTRLQLLEKIDKKNKLNKQDITSIVKLLK